MVRSKYSDVLCFKEQNAHIVKIQDYLGMFVLLSRLCKQQHRMCLMLLSIKGKVRQKYENSVINY